MEVQTVKYLNATKDYKKSMAQQDVKFVAKEYANRSVRSQQEEGGQATANK